MAKFRFTDDTVRKAQGAPARPVIHYDMPAESGKGDYVRGFALQVTPAGTRTFLLVYVAKATGQERRMVVGAYPALSLSAARKRAEELRSLVVAGRDPWQEQKESRATAQAKKATDQHTLGGLLDAYCDALDRAKKPSAAGVRRELKATIADPFPKLWKMPAADVTLDDLVKPLNRLTRAEKWRQAEKTRSYLRAAYTMAAASRGKANASDLFTAYARLPNVARDLTTVDRPRMDDVQADEAEGEAKRPLSQPELAAYWQRIREMQTPAGALLRFHLLSGAQRCAQLARLTEAHIDGDVAVIRDIKGRRRQARRHEVPLTPEALDALDAMRGEAGPHLFTLNGGKTGAGLHQVRRVMLTVAQAMVEAGEVAETFTPGEIRITVETRLQAAGVPMETRAHLQSHGLGGVQNKHYAKHDFAAEKREALEKLRSLCEPVPDNVTPIAPRAKTKAA
ncbi:tyrosine-type recombinase/integrase [Pseudoxanthomonas koreensis]|uniref:tyrosine-type recombinase/integrase n=1 Tax=Pseudoxanthomonas koreensis TaxID=266061 RepID=UPI001390EB9B|nr:integrase arm-type DNA-binding domain-containing protein [Pseudoxanthomonas koreensis]KAF1691848.1 hypothetical protein CSC64_08005 [Pseudoxanthomonas koreensis]